MSSVRDPIFWKRFSMAVHLDEEKAVAVAVTSPTTEQNTTPTKRAELKHSDSWLDRNAKKRRRAHRCGWIIVLVIILALAVLTLACLWLFKVGPFAIRQ